MKTATLALITGALFAAGITAASAQEGKINDGNNPAPNYGTMAPAGGNTSSKIMDGNNPAPGGSTEAAAPKAKQAAKYTTHTHATHHRKTPNS